MAERIIHIVGENTLQNHLLAEFLEASARADCISHRALQDFASADLEQGAEHLVLIDCFGLDPEETLSLIDSQAMVSVAHKRAALFNVSAEASVELAALRCGIRGFFYLHDAPDSLVKGIEALFGNDYWVSRKHLVEFLATPNPPLTFAPHYPGLTLRESELMGLLAKGLSNQSIADRLFISIPTVKSHLVSIYRKINVTSRLQAVCWAERNSSRTSG